MPKLSPGVSGCLCSPIPASAPQKLGFGEGGGLVASGNEPIRPPWVSARRWWEEGGLRSKVFLFLLRSLSSRRTLGCLDEDLMLGYAGRQGWISPGCRLKVHQLHPNASVQSRLSCETLANVLLIRKSLGCLLSYRLSRGGVSPASSSLAGAVHPRIWDSLAGVLTGALSAQILMQTPGKPEKHPPPACISSSQHEPESGA